MSGNTGNGSIFMEHVTKIYRTYPTPRHRLMELISFGERGYSRETRALDDVSFSVSPGGRLGIVGENGSGKSTLLKVLAGVLTPTSGQARVQGRVSALLELGAGFSPELQGIENIRQFCLLHGMHADAIEEAVPQIIQFSELRDAVQHPVKTYSSGMSVRLGFACAVYVQPDILIVDEALSVGDAYFQNKCLHKIKAMLDNGTTFIYVTHAADSIRALCSEGVWMDHGRVRLLGASSAVGSAYQSDVYRRMVHAGLSDAPGDTEKADDNVGIDINAALSASSVSADHRRHAAFQERVAPLRTGSGEVLIQDIVLLSEDGMDTDSVEFGSKLRVQVWFEVQHNFQAECAITLGITDATGREIIHFNSLTGGAFVDGCILNNLSYFEFSFESPLCPGEYGLIAGAGTMLDSPNNLGQMVVGEVFDYCVGGARFNIRFPDEASKFDLWGVVHVPFGVMNPGTI